MTEFIVHVLVMLGALWLIMQGDDEPEKKKPCMICDGTGKQDSYTECGVCGGTGHDNNHKSRKVS